jgi:hypothetical protein
MARPRSSQAALRHFKGGRPCSNKSVEIVGRDTDSIRRDHDTAQLAVLNQHEDVVDLEAETLGDFFDQEQRPHGSGLRQAAAGVGP